MNLDPPWPELVRVVEAAYPDEAYGWLANRRVHGWRGERDRFALTDDQLLALAAAAHGPEPPAALFHSHPDGDAELSAADRDQLAPGGVVLHPLPHLVIAVAGGRARAAALYRWRDGRPVEVARWTDGWWSRR